ncbi:hypothetical protein PUN28_006784 [Cardiocondyla obscurior]|uniref:Uncharacterized protein n=1 Tax=Cardiocondyla obscurior TaxID=286306 RepID=A0AAW2G1Q9_9HYME
MEILLYFQPKYPEETLRIFARCLYPRRTLQIEEIPRARHALRNANKALQIDDLIFCKALFFSQCSFRTGGSFVFTISCNLNVKARMHFTLVSREMRHVCFSHIVILIKKNIFALSLYLFLIFFLNFTRNVKKKILNCKPEQIYCNVNISRASSVGTTTRENAKNDLKKICMS